MARRAKMTEEEKDRLVSYIEGNTPQAEGH
jgi:hypothetical protein